MFSAMRKGNPFEQIEYRAVNRTGGAVTVGMVLSLQFNLDSASATSGEAVGGGPGNVGGDDGASFTAPSPYQPLEGMFVNVVDPTNPAQDVRQISVVVTDLLDGEGADNTEVQVCVQGVCTVDAVSANYDIGDVLAIATNAATTNEVSAFASADGRTPCAICGTEGDSAESLEVMWFGMGSFFGDGNEA